MIKKARSAFSFFLQKVSSAIAGQESSIIAPNIIPRDQHIISRANISSAARKVLYQLKDAGYQAHLVGGGVRDLLLGHEPKDFDVATDATPEQVRQVFRNCRLIGRRFRLAHVHFGREIIEVATFRADRPADQTNLQNNSGMILRDNEYGTIEQDALRRDFSVNALYYNIRDFSLIDYANGVADLRAGILRLMGDPTTRYREDPVRMLRAVRFAVKLGFKIESDTEAPIWQLGYLLRDVPPARLLEEVLKLFMSGQAEQTFAMLHHYQLFAYLFPQTDACLTSAQADRLLLQGLRNTDQRVKAGRSVTPAFLFAILLWEPVRRYAQKLQTEEDMPVHPAINQAATEIFAEQIKTVSIPKRFSVMTREIWGLQARFHYTRGKRPARLLEHPRFRAAYDFLLLRQQNGEVDAELTDWWTAYQNDQTTLLTPSRKQNARPRRRSHAKTRKSALTDV